MYEVESLYGESDPDQEMPRVRGSGSLSNQQRNILRALGAWRELKARKRNLPRNFILSDDAIVSLLKHPPKTADDIRPMKGLSDRALERNRRYIWEAIQRGIEGDLPELPNGRHTGPAPDDGYEARVDLSLAFIKGTCLAAKIDPALIGNRAEVTALVLEAANATEERHRILRGWRGKFCGQHLLSILQGNGSITINSETRLPEYHD